MRYNIYGGENVKESKFDKVKYNNEFNSKAYDRINLTVPKGAKERIQTAAKHNRESVNGLINRVVMAEVEKIEAKSKDL